MSASGIGAFKRCRVDWKSRELICVFVRQCLADDTVGVGTSDVTQLVRRSPVELAQQQSGVLAARMMTEDSADMMEQEDDSLDSEEDGLRQLLLLQQTKYHRLFSVLSLSLSLSLGPFFFSARLFLPG